MKMNIIRESRNYRNKNNHQCLYPQKCRQCRKRKNNHNLRKGKKEYTMAASNFLPNTLGTQNNLTNTTQNKNLMNKYILGLP